MRVITRYACEVCGAWFEEASVAQYCEAKGLPPDIATRTVGDVVHVSQDSGRVTVEARIVAVGVDNPLGSPGDHRVFYELNREVYRLSLDGHVQTRRVREHHLAGVPATEARRGG